MKNKRCQDGASGEDYKTDRNGIIYLRCFYCGLDLGRSVSVGDLAHCENWFDEKLYQIKIGELL